MKIKQLLLLLLASCALPLALAAQSAFSFVEQDRNFVAGTYGIYPEKDLPQLTPAPQGYEPFYISHYGRHGSRYLNDMKGYMEPYKTLHQADSLGMLTDLGKMALREIRLYIADAEGRWGDLAEKGKVQQRRIAHRMLQNFPEVFSDGAFVDARSTIVTRCVYRNRQDKSLRAAASTQSSQKVFASFLEKRWNQDRLMTLLFNDMDYVRQHVDKVWFVYYLMKAALTQQNTDRSDEPNPLLHLFTSEDSYLYWLVENAWSYIHSGFCELNGAKQPYLQVYLLRKMIDEADSVINSQQHGASLRFGHETVLLPLVCLMGINGYDLRTDKFEELEQKGWWANRVYPMAGNLQIVFYRKNASDRNPLLKVLVNEKEATLPLPSDLAPYYRWSDFRDFYLRKVAEGESVLSATKR